MLLNDRSPCSVGELARRSVTKTPTLTRTLIRMESEGLVKRAALADDRRFVDVTMTPKAVKTLRMVQEIGQRVFARAFEGISASETASMTNALKRVRANLERSPYAPAVDAKARAS
jgi:MarR family transcriptional regulator for hemolysin